MPQKIMTKFEIIVTETDKPVHYAPHHQTRHFVISEDVEKAKNEAIKRTPRQYASGHLVHMTAKVISSEDILVET